MDLKATLANIVSKIPIINLLPILEDQTTRIPNAYSSLSDDQKQALARNLLLAVSKAAAAYAGA